MKSKRWIALLLTAVLAIGAMSIPAFAANAADPEMEVSAEERTEKTCRGKHGKKQKTAEPENAVGRDAAKETALADAGVKAEDVGKVKVRVTKLEDGTVVYRVSFTSGDQWYCFKIDAVTGEITEKTTQDAAEHEAAKAARRDPGGSASDAGEEEAGRSSHSRRGGRHGARGSASDEAASGAEPDSSRRHGSKG